LGTASRCFTDIQASQDGLALTETSFLTLQGGTIVARNRVTIQPLLETVDNMTHLIGAVPAVYVNNLLVDHNSGQFQEMSGRLRSGGVVDLSNFRENNELVFDDIAVITFVDNREQVKRAQALLEEANMYTGDIDGIFGPNTASALRQYQTKHGLPVTGELDEATRKALSIP
jgi:murein L,D-transpeptidase YcbB/YkuD